MKKSLGARTLGKVRPLSFTPDTQEYFGIGNFIGKAFSIGNRF
jgi:hypothetical protein